jgi:hypothetical protein
MASFFFLNCTNSSRLNDQQSYLLITFLNLYSIKNDIKLKEHKTFYNNKKKKMHAILSSNSKKNIKNNKIQRSITKCILITFLIVLLYMTVLIRSDQSFDDQAQQQQQQQQQQTRQKARVSRPPRPNQFSKPHQQQQQSTQYSTAQPPLNQQQQSQTTPKAQSPKIITSPQLFFNTPQAAPFTYSDERLNQTHANMFSKWLDSKSDDLFELSMNYSGFKLLNETYNIHLRKDAKFAWINFTEMIIDISNTISEVLYNKTLVVKNLTDVVEKEFDKYRNDTKRVIESAKFVYYDAKSPKTFCDVQEAQKNRRGNLTTTTSPSSPNKMLTTSASTAASSLTKKTNKDSSNNSTKSAAASKSSSSSSGSSSSTAKTAQAKLLKRTSHNKQHEHDANKLTEDYNTLHDFIVDLPSKNNQIRLDNTEKIGKKAKTFLFSVFYLLKAFGIMKFKSLLCDIY